MKKYVAAALTIGIAIGPASALDAGLGGNIGGLGVGAGVSAGSQGASVGVGASVGGVGGANVGASVGAGNAGVSASGNVGNTGVSASGNVGTTGGGVSTGVGPGANPSAESGSAAAPGGQAAATTATGSSTTATASATTATAFTKTARQSIALPSILRPSKAGQGDLTRGYPFAPLEALKAKPGTPAAVVLACRTAIMSAAKPLGAVRVRAVSAGALRQRGGALLAPIKVRIDYAGRGGIEVRQAQVGCRLDTAGRVTAVI
ncbi:hypothetical protein DBIPINDM_004993 [Mesorhizobium sp. AR02]|uniref:hypothetical protein n=1 Tax=Mesorhizobium sp. AR02 TaxID=2865837 RepID=UPI0021607A9C|nr:hypothetical protein [Mesorhizobium sp. AR02]UVK51692.1 hypothetical protein DBIPINDM_004993 [Mesorhizobium sp. AR02]